MNRSLASKSTGRPVCTQPDCLLKKPGLGIEELAECLVLMLAGESVERVMPGSSHIEFRPLCKHCALRVLSSKNTYRTEAEWDKLDDLGHWHHRRRQRSERRLC